MEIKCCKQNKNLIIENKALKNCLARLEKKIDKLKEDIRRDIAGDVKKILIKTMKENEKILTSKNGNDIGKQLKEYINIAKTRDKMRKDKTTSFFTMCAIQKVNCQQHVMIMTEINA